MIKRECSDGRTCQRHVNSFTSLYNLPFEYINCYVVYSTLLMTDSQSSEQTFMHNLLFNFDSSQNQLTDVDSNKNKFLEFFILSFFSEHQKPSIKYLQDLNRELDNRLEWRHKESL